MTKKELKNILRNHCTEQDKTELIQWVLSEKFDDDLEKYISEDLEIELAQKHRINDVELNTMAAKIISKARKETNTTVNPEHEIPTYSGDWQNRSGLGFFYKIAATLLLVALFTFIAFHFTKNTTEHVKTATAITKENQRGRKSTIFLKDGSIVYLNAESSIRYPEVFPDSARIVKLQGEAYFDIARDPDKPFIVQVGNLRVSVLGTSFNINAYEENEFELKNVNVEMKEGELAALVGPSGSGKTTITNLLLRFYDLNSGHIKIGGVDIKDMDYNDLLDNISIVMQNVILFADSIYENIKVGNKNATKQEVIEAAKKAMIHDFIMTLPDGYDTVVGENGAGLSGGQKQRISIARAFLKDAPIVILDEATSNVDPINERKIQIAISNLAKGRTLIVIAHHLQTIRSADQILVFNEGRIVERGKYDELIAKEGLFRMLWDAQKQAKEWLLCS